MMVSCESNEMIPANIDDPAARQKNDLHCALARWQSLIGMGRGVQKWRPGSVQRLNEGIGNRSYLVEKGVIALTHALNNGRQVFIALRRPGEMFGHDDLFLGCGFYLSACALTDVEVRVTDLRWLVEQIKKGGEAGLLVAQQHERDLGEKTAELSDVMHMDASVRFQRLLSQIAGVLQSGPARDVHIDLPLTDSHIASLLGISAQQFSAVKRKLNRVSGTQYIKGKRTWIISSNHVGRGES
jgi:CRP-like cAMP-binding protein